MHTCRRAILGILTLVCFSGPPARAQGPADDRRVRAVLEPWCYQLYLADQAGAQGVQSRRARPAGDATRGLQHVDRALLADGRIRVQLDTGPGGAAAADLRLACTAAAPTLCWEGATGRIAQATLAIRELADLAAVPGLFCILRPPTGLPMVTSAGVAEIGAAVYHDLGLDGSGVTIGVLDISFAQATDLLGSELPADTRLEAFAVNPDTGRKSLVFNNSAHGTACAELVHDIAPGASLCLANARTTVEMEAAVRWMRDQGVAIISHSVGWFHGPGDGTGAIAEIAHEAIDSGILWVNAAGNQATGYWGGTFRDTDGNGRHEFDAEGDETITYRRVPETTEFSVVLTWDRWPYSPDLAFDVEIREIHSMGETVVSSADALSSPNYAYRQIIGFRTGYSASTVEITIHRKRGNDAPHLRLFRLDNELAEHNMPEGSLVLPADSPRVLSVGAYRTGLAGRRLLEDFSSRGPNLVGVAKPELCALDAVMTSSEGQFHGTSAACPQVAAAIALLYQTSPAAGFFDFRWSLEETRSLLAWSARPIDLGTAGGYVWGVLDLPAARSATALSDGPRLAAISPARPPIQARLLGSAAGPFELRVFDPLGRLIRASELSAAPGVSPTILSWDGRDRRGRPVASGRYLLTARGAGWFARHPVLILR